MLLDVQNSFAQLPLWCTSSTGTVTPSKFNGKERFPGDIICLARVNNNNNNNNKFITYIVQITWVYDETCITYKKLTLQD